MGGRAVASREEKWEAVEHGTTYGMAQRCYRLNPDGTSCEECKAVRNDYVAKWRATGTQAAEKAAVHNSARSKALTRLARSFPTEFRKLFNEEVVKIYAEELKTVGRKTAIGPRHQRSKG